MKLLEDEGFRWNFLEQYILLCRNVVLQSELVDEELEHFEDIVEEADNKEINASREENKFGSILDDSVKDDHSSEEEEDGSPVSSSDDDELSDEAAELLIKNLSPNTQGVELSKNKIDQSGVNLTDSLLPGGYNPRHREPSYW